MTEEEILDESILCDMVNVQTKKEYQQNLKRKNLLNRLCLFTNSTGHRKVGQVIGFTTAGGIMVIEKDGSQPMEGTGVRFLVKANV